MSVFFRALGVVALLTVTGCGRSCGRASETSPDAAAIPAEVAFTVDVEGAPPVRIDAPLLARTPPDFVTDPWRGWKLAKLVPSWSAGAAVDVEDDEGLRATLIAPGENVAGTAPVLLVGPDGETRAIRLADGRPITAHQGASRRDSGRVRHVRRIRVRSVESAQKEPPPAGPPITLKVVVGDTVTTWTRAELDRVRAISLMSKDGDGERQAWSLRDLATVLGGPGAMVTEVIGDGRLLAIADAKWNQREMIPVLRANRRGRLKFVWLTDKLDEIEDEEELRAITEIHVKRAR